MTSTPSDEPQVPPTGATPPPPPPGYQAPPPGYQAPPPGYQAPPADGYGAPGGGYAGAPAPTYGAVAPLSDSDQRMWATIAHIGGIILGFVAPLVVWLMHKERGRFVEEQSKEALNFQILVTIAYVVGTVTSVIGIGLVIMFLAWLFSVIFAILAAVATNKGEAYRYPVSLRLIK